MITKYNVTNNPLESERSALYDFDSAQEVFLKEMSELRNTIITLRKENEVLENELNGVAKFFKKVMGDS